ncbi:hypothetical protein GS429_10005 [Natronorubrum sp. JWXQ-INN-674]|uniref:Yip1 domain-containing protein n=1 Tax=Natronorubrum halalkaliphilum TaxID=2691917 RepID=A0A6B0VLF2_9EURY|nr:YIP1 family protein [Natronorubrum halalkaliphilum]MXV62390.1 hypothetical protein [Natronorubrum halalkaliphilum]
MVRTPLVAPGAYFARADAFPLQLAVGLAVVHWLGSLAVSLFWQATGEIALDPLTLYALLQALEATLLYWVVPALVLYGVGFAVDAEGEPSEMLALAAWGLVPLLAGELVSNLFLYGLTALEVDPAAVPVEPEVWLFVPLILAACGWAAFVWRGGLRSGFGLDRSTATATALSAAGVCAGLLLLPIAFA